MQTFNKHYDLAIAWTWDLDKDFVSAIEAAARNLGVSVIQVTTHNLDEVTRRISDGSLTIAGYFDRASDEDEQFLSITSMVENRFSANGTSSILTINPRTKAQRASDKATMHLELTAKGVRVPQSLIIPSFEEKSDYLLSAEDLTSLGSRFVVKPANSTGGSNGVRIGISSWEQVQEARESLRHDKFLLQERIKPAYLGDFRAWFRVFYAFGDTILCWWDDQTHVYEEVSFEDRQNFSLSVLHDSIRRIQEVCELDFFSTEFAYATAGEFVAIDYVNEICDMRPQSKFSNGVPDRVVTAISIGLVRFFLEKKTHPPTY